MAESTTESNMRQRREYGKESAAAVGEPGSTGPATAEDSHWATVHGRSQEEEGGGETSEKFPHPTSGKRVHFPYLTCMVIRILIYPTEEN